MPATTCIASADVALPPHGTGTAATNPNPYTQRLSVIPSQLIQVSSAGGTGGTGGGPGGLGDTAGGAAWMHRVG